MLSTDTLDNNARIRDYIAQDEKRQELEEEAKRNKNFVQVYPLGWKRLQQLMKDNPTAARLYAFLCEHIDGQCGAVVVSQDILSKELDCHIITIKRQTKYLEDVGALVRIRIGTGIYAYCLDPREVWKSWDSKKEHAGFITKTLVSKSDRANQKVSQRLKIMVSERKKENDLFDQEHETDS